MRRPGQIAAFTAVTYAGAWLVMLPSWLSGDGLQSPLAWPSMAGMMFVPGVVASMFAWASSGRRWSAAWTSLGCTPVRPFRRSARNASAAIGIAALMVVLGWLAAWILGGVSGDLDRSQAHHLIVDALGSEPPMPMWALMLLQLLGLPVGVLLTAVAALGEEAGWRGWLLPTLTPYGTAPALIVSGVIWGAWHAPVILLGYNFDQPNGLGLAMMIVGCVLVGVVLGLLRLWSGSLWPSVFAHAAFNVFATYQVFLVRPDHDAVLTGPLAVTGWWATLVVIGAMLVWRRRTSRAAGEDVRHKRS